MNKVKLNTDSLWELAVSLSYIHCSIIRIDHLEGSDVDRRIILKWIFRKWDGVHGLD